MSVVINILRREAKALNIPFSVYVRNYTFRQHIEFLIETKLFENLERPYNNNDGDQGGGGGAVDPFLAGEASSTTPQNLGTSLPLNSACTILGVGSTYVCFAATMNGRNICVKMCRDYTNDSARRGLQYEHFLLASCFHGVVGDFIDVPVIYYSDSEYRFLVQSDCQVTLMDIHEHIFNIFRTSSLPEFPFDEDEMFFRENTNFSAKKIQSKNMDPNSPLEQQEQQKSSVVDESEDFDLYNSDSKVLYFGSNSPVQIDDSIDVPIVSKSHFSTKRAKASILQQKLFPQWTSMVQEAQNQNIHMNMDAMFMMGGGGGANNNGGGAVKGPQQSNNLQNQYNMFDRHMQALSTRKPLPTSNRNAMIQSQHQGTGSHGLGQQQNTLTIEMCEEFVSLEELFQAICHSWSCKLLKIIRKIHACGFVHCDIKPYNIMINIPRKRVSQFCRSLTRVVQASQQLNVSQQSSLFSANGGNGGGQTSGMMMMNPIIAFEKPIEPSVWLQFKPKTKGLDLQFFLDLYYAPLTLVDFNICKPYVTVGWVDRLVLDQNNNNSSIYTINNKQRTTYKPPFIAPEDLDAFDINPSNFNSTPIFASIRTHLGERPTRKDDIEMLMYTIAYLEKGSLPWINQEVYNNGVGGEIMGAQTKEFIKRNSKSCLVSKSSYPIQTIGLSNDTALHSGILHARAIGFFEEPNYKELIQCFKETSAFSVAVLRKTELERVSAMKHAFDSHVKMTQVMMNNVNHPPLMAMDPQHALQQQQQQQQQNYGAPLAMPVKPIGNALPPYMAQGQGLAPNNNGFPKNSVSSSPFQAPAPIAPLPPPKTTSTQQQGLGAPSSFGGSAPQADRKLPIPAAPTKPGNGFVQPSSIPKNNTTSSYAQEIPKTNASNTVNRQKMGSGKVANREIRDEDYGEVTKRKVGRSKSRHSSVGTTDTTNGDDDDDIESYEDGSYENGSYDDGGSASDDDEIYSISIDT